MRLIVECEHGHLFAHRAPLGLTCAGGYRAEDPDAILAALAEAGVLEVEEIKSGSLRLGELPRDGVRYVSPWKEAK